MSAKRSLEGSQTENANGHAEVDANTNDMAESAGRLGDGKLVDEGVKEARDGEDAEVPESCAHCRLRGHVQQSEEGEHWHVLEII
jgi:hypothetical protein